MWEFNTKYRRDKLIMIVFVHNLAGREKDCSRFQGRMYKNKIICWLSINKPKSTTPLFRGYLPGSRGCPLNRGSTLFWSYLPIKLSRSKSSWLLSRLMSLSVILEFSAMPFKTSLSSSSPDKLWNSSRNRKKTWLLPQFKSNPRGFFLLFAHHGKSSFTVLANRESSYLGCWLTVFRNKNLLKRLVTNLDILPQY